MLTGTSAPIQTNPIHQFDKYYYGPLPGTIYVVVTGEVPVIIFFIPTSSYFAVHACRPFMLNSKKEKNLFASTHKAMTGLFFLRIKKRSIFATLTKSAVENIINRKANNKKKGNG